MEFVFALSGFLVGLLAGWVLAQKTIFRTREELAVVKARAEEREKSTGREKEFFERSVSEMKSNFLGMAQNALRANNQQFLQNTEIKLKPLADVLKALNEKTGEIEKKRVEAYGQLSEQIKGMVDAAGGMLRSSERMQSLLKGSSEVRGNWGEYLLRNVVEFAGMKKHVHFDEQLTLSDGSRPDMVIRLPNGGGVPVDSKCPFNRFQEAKEEGDPSRVRELMKAHANAVRKHVDGLSKKDYSAVIEGELDFTVMFIPGDHLLEAALAVDPQLQDDAFKKRILIANPVSLVALLRTVRIYWRQEETERDSRQIAEAARELYERATVWTEHVGKIGKGLSSAVDAFNRSVGSWERRVLPAGKKLQELNVPGPDDGALGDGKFAPSRVDQELRRLPGCQDDA